MIEAVVGVSAANDNGEVLSGDAGRFLKQIIEQLDAVTAKVNSECNKVDRREWGERIADPCENEQRHGDSHPINKAQSSR